jgi:UV DNA damage repair endonuclease
MFRRVLMHLSEHDPTKQMGAHSDYIEHLPSELFETMIRYDLDIDLEIEAKQKEQAIFHLYDIYQFI